MSSLDFLTEVIDVELKSDSPDEFDNESDGQENAEPPPQQTVRKVHEREALEANLQACHQTRNLFRSNLSVVTFHKTEYLIGVQVARRLKRKTFNMYRCMKKKKIELRRATQDEVDYLTLVGAVHPGTHSITLVPFDECLFFVADALFRHIRFPNEDLTAKRRKSFVSMRPRIHRRKPLPWDIQRSVRKSPQKSPSESDPLPHQEPRSSSPLLPMAKSSLPPYSLPKSFSAGQVIYSLPASFSTPLPPSLISSSPHIPSTHSSPAVPSHSQPQIPPYSLGQCGFRPAPPLSSRISPQPSSQLNSQLPPQIHSQLSSQPPLSSLNPLGVIGFTR